jgi:NADPH-dependent curcumin reductase CurA
MTLNREVHLMSRPSGRPVPEDFALVTRPIPSPEPGQVVVRNLFMSLDPGTRLRMEDLGLPIPAFALGRPMTGDAIGEVVESAAPGLRPGDLVRHPHAWRDYAVAEAADFRPVDRDAYPSPSHHLNSGLIAYVGMVEIAAVRPGDTVYVSSAAGAVGGLAGQIARLKGASRVVGSAGSPAKAEFVTGVLGFDAAYDRHSATRPRDLAPGGVDVYFDNVGGSGLEDAIDAMNPHGRIVLCGAMERQSGGGDQGPRNLLAVIGKRLTLRGFTAFDHPGVAPRFAEEFGAWVRNGEIVLHETVVDGLENGVTALLAQLDGAYVGKVVLRP